MSVDWAEEKASKRDRLLAFLADLQWHLNGELPKVAGNRYAARLLELRRLGYQIETKNLPNNGGKAYRLASLLRGAGLGKKVKAFLDERDVKKMLSQGAIPPRARAALSDALASFIANKDKL